MPKVSVIRRGAMSACSSVPTALRCAPAVRMARGSAAGALRRHHGQGQRPGLPGGLAAAMQQIDPEMRFAIIGEGKQRQMLEQKAAELGVLDVNLFFLGRKPKTEVVDWIDASTLTLALLSGPREIWKGRGAEQVLRLDGRRHPDRLQQHRVADDHRGGRRDGFPDLAGFSCRRRANIAERLSDADWLAAVPGTAPASGSRLQSRSAGRRGPRRCWNGRRPRPASRRRAEGVTTSSAA